MAAQAGITAQLAMAWLVAGVVLAAPCAAQDLTQMPPDSPAAVVNDEIITVGELLEELTQRYGQSILEELILEWMTETRAAELGIEVTREQAIDAACEQLSTDERPLTTAQDLAAACAQAGGDFDLLISDVRHELLAEKVFEADVKITEDEARGLYERQPDSFARGFQAHLRTILLGDERTAEGLLPGLTPETFAGLAQQFSEDESRRASGGDWGFVGLDQLPANGELRVFVAGAQAGAISPIIEAEGGYVIALVEEVIADAPMSFEQARDTVYAVLFEQRKGLLMNEWVDRARRMARMLSLDATVSAVAPLPSRDEAMELLEMAEEQERKTIDQPTNGEF